MKLITYNCPVCGGTIQIDSERAKCFCMYCGNEIKIESEYESVAVDGIASLEATLTRAEQFLRMKQFETAYDYYSRALDLKPDCARAFIGQILANSRCLRLEQLNEDIRYTQEYKVAYDCASDEERVWLDNTAKQIRASFEKRYAEDMHLGVSIDNITNYNLLWTQNKHIPLENTPFDQYNNVADVREPLAKWDYFRIEESVAVLLTDEVRSIMEVLPYLEECLKNDYKRIIVVCKRIEQEPLTTFMLNSFRDTLYFAVVLTNEETILELKDYYKADLFTNSTWDGNIVMASKAYLSRDKALLIAE